MPDFIPIIKIIHAMIKQTRGEETINAYKKAASVVFANNDVVTVDASGFLVRATAATTKAKLLGLIQRDVLATDSDYAQNSMVPVLEFGDPEAEFTADVGTGTATQAMVGSRYDLKDHDEIDVAASAIGCFQIKKFISASKVVGKFIVY